MPFQPAFCPYSACPSRSRASPFQWHRRGQFERACDGRVVQRFACRACRRTFSTQSFRLDRGLRKPGLHIALFDLLVSKVTHRQSARLLGCTRKTVVHRIALLGDHSRAFQRQRLAALAAGGGLPGDFQFDELETFEHSRRLAPVTMPVLIELHSYFVVSTAAESLPCRGRLTAREQQKKEEREAREGRRLNRSREAVGACLKDLARCVDPKREVTLSSDRKSSYPKLIRETLGPRARHAKHSSRARRDYGNPLFPINHTLAMLRDGLSRLVRRNWAASKKREWLTRHAWIWIAYRNFVRGVSNRLWETTPAMALGVADRRLDARALFTWRLAPAPTPAPSP